MVILESGLSKFYYFWGGEFSNFYSSPIAYNGELYPTSEHLYMVKKAEFFGDIFSREKMLKVSHPADAKRLGRKVRNFCPDKWKTVARDYMYIACYLKFTQNEVLKELILSEHFDNTLFVEASPYDVIWGIGIGVEDAVNGKPWRGTNHLGQVLTELRKTIKLGKDDIDWLFEKTDKDWNDEESYPQAIASSKEAHKISW